MSVREISQPAHDNREVSGRGSTTVRLNVEQASFAYAATAESAPTFTLGATSFQARERELVAILGPNASGKSTLLRLISGTIAPLSGRVELDEYFKVSPRLPDEDKLRFSGFVNQHTAVEVGTGHQVNIVLASQPPENEKLSIEGWGS